MPLEDLVVVVAATPERRRADDWSLVLQAERIPSRMQVGDDGYRLCVRDIDFERARNAVAGFERDLDARRERKRPRVAYGPSLGGVVLAAAILALHMAFESSAELADLGVARSRAILRGDAWLALTALTLHADAGHALANAASAALFATLLFRALGPGLGGSAMLLAGTFANLLNAWFQGPGHASVGASSALFGAIGVLSGLQFADRWRHRLQRRQAWLPLAAGLGLVAMLGTGGIRTDVSAHVFGLVCGIPLGAGVGFALERAPGPVTQVLLIAAAIGSLVGAWLLTLS